MTDPVQTAPTRPTAATTTAAPARRPGIAGDDTSGTDFSRLIDADAGHGAGRGTARAANGDDGATTEGARKRTKAPKPDETAARTALTGDADAAPLPPCAGTTVQASVPLANNGEALANAPSAGQPPTGQPPTGQTSDVALPTDAAVAGESTPSASGIRLGKATPPDGEAAGRHTGAAPVPGIMAGAAATDKASATAAGASSETAGGLVTADGDASAAAIVNATPPASAAFPTSAPGEAPTGDGSASKSDDRATLHTPPSDGGARHAHSRAKEEPSTAASAPKTSPTTGPSPHAGDAAASSGSVARAPATADTAPPSTLDPPGVSAPRTGFEAVPALPAQSAAQYAAAAASGRLAAGHAPAMAQITAPLIRVADGGGGTFQIDLSPAELGRVRVVADVSEGKVTLTVQAQHADTLALLRRDLQHLEQALDSAGLSLDNTSLQFSLQGDGRSGGFAAPRQGGGETASWYAPQPTETATDAAADPTTDRVFHPIDGLVDLTI